MRELRNVKRAARILLKSAGLGSLVKTRQRLRGDRPSAAALEGSLSEKFAWTYRTGAWQANPGGSRSGPGSDLPVTDILRELIPVLLRGYKVRTLLDAGCGDFNWMKEMDVPCHYVGVDVVPDVIRANDAAYARADRTFLCRDLVGEELPSADLVICREVLFHLSYADCRRTLANLLHTGAGLLLLTSNGGYRFNVDIATGDYREINLERRPFLLPAPILSIRDDSVSAGRFLGLWKSSALASRLQEWGAS